MMTKSFIEQDGILLHDNDYFIGRCNSSLKGLLKPFKGKEEYALFLDEINITIKHLEKISQRLVDLTKETLPLKYLPVYLRVKKSRGGASLLYWRSSKSLGGEFKTKELEGRFVVLNCLNSNKLSFSEKKFIKELEIDRISINNQISIYVRIKNSIKKSMSQLDELMIFK
ncbi:DUF3158 family protein [Gilliamella apicola]|uniref:DUF3158 family protein n=1 Tax=Gilliamella apicola TaxID=1196095 RepID=UPI002FEDED13